jgi:hypothetical protein
MAGLEAGDGMKTAALSTSATGASSDGKVNSRNSKFDRCIGTQVDIERRFDICRDHKDRSAMKISVLGRDYGASKAMPGTAEASDWLAGATIGFAALLTVAWNGLLLWLMWQLF